MRRKLLRFILGTLLLPPLAVRAQQPIRITDGTNGPVAVKPAATQPALADAGQVVSLSPNNSGLPVNLLTTVQKHAAASSGSVSSLANVFSSNTIAGNSLVVSFCNGNNNAPAAPITDTLSSTWAKAVHVVNGSAFECDIWYAVGITGGADTVTVTPGGSNASIASEIYEISGLLALSVAQGDVFTSNSGSSGTASSVAIVPEASNSIVIGAVGIGTGAQTITPAAGWTNDSTQQNPATPAGLFSFVGMSQFADDVVSLVPSATFTSEPWAIVSALFHAPYLPVSGMVRVPATTPAIADTASRCTLVSTASTNATNCKAFAGNVYGFRFVNTTATLYYLRMYDLAVAPTCSSATGFIETIPIPASATGAGIVAIEPMGEGYDTGIGFCFTGGSSSTDNTNAAAGVFGTILYK